MASEEQIALLKSGVSDWNDWRKRNPKTLVDLVFADLSGFDLCGFDLSGANLYGANLNGAKLRDAVLTRAVLVRASLWKAILSGVIAKGAYLTTVDLNGADLTNANLSGADLANATLVGAKANLANLSHAWLVEANLTKISLVQADLTEAYLNGTNFSRAILDNTSFEKAVLSQTIFAFTCLGTVKGLNTCAYLGRSSIDFETLMNSGVLPDVLLHGCGFSDEFIHYLPSFRNDAIQFYSCFISYSHADKSFARRLHDALQGRGIRCWLDEHRVLPGDKIHHAIDEGIRLWDKVLLCCSENSLGPKSWWVDKEVEKALMKEEKLSKERGKEVLAIIPLNLDGFMFKKDWTDWKQQHLTTRLAPDFSGWDKDNAKFEAQLERVIQALRADTAARQPPPKPRL